jgi:hypothetical protein
VVKQIVGNTVSLTNAFPATFSPGDAGLQIHKWVPIRNVGIEGPLLIDASSHTTNPVYGVTVTDEALSRFDGIRGRKLNYVIMTNDPSLHSGYANTFENLGADRSGDTQYDAFYFLGETSSQFANLQARGGLGAIWGIQWRGNSYINASNLLAQCQGDNITPGGRNIKLAATLYSNFTNIIANCSGDNGLALSWGSAHNNFLRRSSRTGTSTLRACGWSRHRTTTTNSTGSPRTATARATSTSTMDRITTSSTARTWEYSKPGATAQTSSTG